MTEKRYNVIKKEVFKEIINNNYSKSKIDLDINNIKKNMSDTLDKYENLNASIQNEAARNLTLEKFNLILLNKETKKIEYNFYNKRAELYLKCIFALSQDNLTDYKIYLDEFVLLLQEQAMKKYDLDIKLLRQKRLVYNKTISYLKTFDEEKQVAIKNKIMDIFDKKEIDYDNMIQFELEEEKSEMKKNFGSKDFELDINDMEKPTILKLTPIDFVKRIYPYLQDDSLLKTSEKRSKSA